MNWKTYPMGGAAWERMHHRGLKAEYSHAVNVDTLEPLCSVKLFSLCHDDSLATSDLPDCPVCRRRIARLGVAVPSGEVGPFSLPSISA